MRTVWKFPLALTSGAQKIEMPFTADLRHVHCQVIAGRDYVVIWAEVDTESPTVDRTFRIYATGEPIETGRYVGTAHLDWTVWHVYLESLT